MQVNIRILDDNDNAPVFRIDPYTITVFESTAPNTVILTTFASDSDIGSNANLTFSFIEGNTSGN